MSVLFVIQNHSDRALKAIVAQLSRCVLFGHEAKWAKERRDMVNREIERREQEDKEGQK